MRIRLLGTGTPTPSLKRMSSGYLVETGERKILFDFGPGAYQPGRLRLTETRRIEDVVLMRYEPTAPGTGPLPAAADHHWLALACELAADYFSGFVLARVGASLADAQAAQRLASVAETGSHPDTESRLRAIESGWRDGHAGLAISQTPIERMNALPVVVIPDVRACDSTLPVTLDARLDRW